MSPSPAPGFQQGGKLDVPAFGIEASEGEREEAAAALEDYLQAREEGKWARACTHLVASTRSQLLSLAAQLNPAKSKNCADALELTTNEYSSSRENLAGKGVSSLRIKAAVGAGFALFHGSDGVDYWMPMRIESGEWRVLSAAPTELNASR